MNSSPLIELKRILVPTDFSARSKDAIEAAAALARAQRSELIILHVIEPVVLPTGGFAEHTITSFDSKLWFDAADKELRAIADEQKSRGTAALETQVRIGRPFHEIVAAAKEESADLIVIGSAGHAPVTYALLGSTVERVARLAPCSVLIVRPKEAAGAGTRPPRA